MKRKNDNFKSLDNNFTPKVSRKLDVEVKISDGVVQELHNHLKDSYQQKNIKREKHFMLLEKTFDYRRKMIVEGCGNLLDILKLFPYLHVKDFVSKYFYRDVYYLNYHLYLKDFFVILVSF